MTSNVGIRLTQRLLMGLRVPMLAAILVLGGGRASAGEKKGVIEITSKSVNGQVFDIEETPWRSRQVTIHMRKSAAVPLGVQLNRNNKKFGKQAIDETVEIVARLYQMLREEGGLSAGDITIVGAPGLSEARDRDDLAEAIRKRTGKTINLARSEIEFYYAMLALMPNHYMDEAVFVDGGSQQTSSGCFLPAGPKQLAQLQCPQKALGAATFKIKILNAQKPRESFAQAAERLSEDLVKDFRRDVEKFPALQNRKDVLITGGAVWGLVVLLHPERANSRYIAITAKDIERYVVMLRKANGQLPAPNFKGIASAEVRLKAEQDYKTLSDRFLAEDLLAGAEILRSMSIAYRFEGRRLNFVRDGNVAWAALYASENCRDITQSIDTR